MKATERGLRDSNSEGWKWNDARRYLRKRERGSGDMGLSSNNRGQCEGETLRNWRGLHWRRGCLDGGKVGEVCQLLLL